MFNFSSLHAAFSVRSKWRPFLKQLVYMLWFCLVSLRVSEWMNKQFRKVFVSPNLFSQLFVCGLHLSENTSGRPFHYCYIKYIYSRPTLTRGWHLRQATRKVAIIECCNDTTYVRQCKAVPLQVWSGPEGSRKLRFPDFVTTAQDVGKVVSLTHRSPLHPRKCSWYSFLLEVESTPGP